jgi:hypothetical protein
MALEMDVFIAEQVLLSLCAETASPIQNQAECQQSTGAGTFLGKEISH